MPITPELFCENCFPLIEPVTPQNAPTELNKSLLVLGNNNPTFVQVVDLNTDAIVEGVNKASVVDPVEIGCVWGVKNVFTGAASGFPRFLIIGGTYNDPTRVVERATMVGSDPSYADATVLTAVAEGMIIGSGGEGFRVGVGVALRLFRQGGTMLLQRQTGGISPSNTQIDYVGPWATVAEWTYRLYDTYSIRVYAQNTFTGDAPNALGRVFARLEVGRNGVGVYNENFTIVAPFGSWTSQQPFGGAYVQEGLWSLETLNPARVTDPDHRFAMYMMEGVAVPDEVPSGGSYKPHPQFGTLFESCANPVPSPQFTSTYDPSQPAPATVTFTDITPGATTSTWDFGDGSSGAGTPVTHTFTSAGTYLVTLQNEFGVVAQELTFVAPLAVPPGIAVDLHKLAYNEYSYIRNRGQNTPIPTYIFTEGQYPTREVKLWPIPRAPGGVELWLWQPLDVDVDLDAPLSLPPGYERALKWNLAMEIAPEYGREVTEYVAAAALASKAAVQRMNIQPLRSNLSKHLGDDKDGQFNYITGRVGPDYWNV